MPHGLPLHTLTNFFRPTPAHLEGMHQLDARMIQNEFSCYSSQALEILPVNPRGRISSCRMDANALQFWPEALSIP